MNTTAKRLKQIISEEIAEALTMIDDPYDDAHAESFAKMDEVASIIEQRLTTEVDEVISKLTNYLVTENPAASNDGLANEGMAILRSLGLSFPDEGALDNYFNPDPGPEDPEGYMS